VLHGCTYGCTGVPTGVTRVYVYIRGYLRVLKVGMWYKEASWALIMRECGIKRPPEGAQGPIKEAQGAYPPSRYSGIPT